MSIYYTVESDFRTPNCMIIIFPWTHIFRNKLTLTKDFSLSGHACNMLGTVSDFLSMVLEIGNILFLFPAPVYLAHYWDSALCWICPLCSHIQGIRSKGRWDLQLLMFHMICNTHLVLSSGNGSFFNFLQNPFFFSPTDSSLFRLHAAIWRCNFCLDINRDLSTFEMKYLLHLFNCLLVVVLGFVHVFLISSYLITWEIRERTDLVALAGKRKSSSLQNP